MAFSVAITEFVGVTGLAPASPAFVGPGIPPFIRISGTATGCVGTIKVESSCTGAMAHVQPTAPSGLWSVVMRNAENCACGDPKLVQVTCESDGSVVPQTEILQCGRAPAKGGCCDLVDIDFVTSPIPCLPPMGGAVTVAFQAILTRLGAPCVGGSIEWKVTGPTGSVLQPYTAGPANFAFQFAAVGTYHVYVRVTQDPTCGEYSTLDDHKTVQIAACIDCALDVTGPTQTDCTDGANTAPQTYTVTPTPANFIGPYDWEVKLNGQTIYQDSGTNSTSLSYAFPGPGLYTVLVSADAPPACGTLTFAGATQVLVPRCTPGPPTTQPPRTPPPATPPPATPPPATPPPATPPPASAFSWCCFLIVGWAIINAIFGLLLYFDIESYWPVGTIVVMVVGAIATILLLIWLFLCCWPCILRFWSCCEFWQWQFISVSWVTIALGIFEGLCRFLPVFCGDALIIMIYGSYLGTVFLVMSAIGSCGRLPNPLDPRTWPPCCCTGRLGPCP
jgi:hypothetical protein